MSRSLLGAGLGATGATLYLKPEVLQDWARDVMFGPSSRPAAPGGKELEQLQRLVRARRSPPASDAACPCVGRPTLPLQSFTRRYALPPKCCHNRLRTCLARWPPARRAV